MAKDKNKRKPTAVDWDRIVTYYLRGESMQYIIDHMPDLDVTKTQIINKMSRGGYVKKRRELNERVADKISKDLEHDKEVNSKSCISAYKKGLDIINSLLKAYKEEMENPNIGIRSKKCTAYNMDMLMSGITKIQKGFDVAFGVDKNGKLVEKEPDVLVIEGMNLDEI